MTLKSSIPVLIAPPSITKQLKVALDTAGWRDKNRLIARYSQLVPSASEEHGQPPGYDLSTYMAMALLPTLPFSRSASSQLSSLWDQCQQLDTSTLPDTLQDPAIQKLLYLTWLDSNLFTTPRHLLVQTPYEKLKDGLTKFLTPYLTSWPSNSQISIDSLPALLASIPQKWEHYSDFTLLPPAAFLAEPWPQVLGHLLQLDHQSQQQGSSEPSIMDHLERLVQDALGSTHIARKAIIPVQDILRRPKIRPLTGDWGIHSQFKSWIEHDTALLDHHNVQDQPQVEALTHATDAEPTPENFGSAYWAMTCQNHVWYSWAPMFTMFSAGNITEKERVAHSRPIFDARDKVVVDLYAGIGYFTLVYLLHAGARTVHACEWNPWSVEGLARGADRNGIRWSKVSSLEDSVAANRQESNPAQGQESAPSKQAQRTPKKLSKPAPLGNLVIYPGDNAQWISCFENQAHHVNLGLIPSAELGWVLGVRALCPKEGGYLHVHHNIRVGEEESFRSYLLKSLEQQFAEWKTGQVWELHIRHMENIKSFAPLVFHYVADVECRPRT
ncbi:hypothetical protein BGZ93_005320 [Podila epicladia]|nr:hypothetical protein BGZ93_005320 [Podila epicladia]